MNGALANVSLPMSPGAVPMDLDGSGCYVHWGAVQFSVANLVAGVVLVVFILALIMPFPRGRGRR